MKCLIVRQPWVDKILDGSKLWEMRSRSTTVRGRIGIIEAGTGTIVGEVTLTDVAEPIRDMQDAEATTCFHQVENISLLKKWRYPWVMAEPVRYEKPVPYQHPKGAVVWVNV